MTLAESIQDLELECAETSHCNDRLDHDGGRGVVFSQYQLEDSGTPASEGSGKQ